jgi:hypothetical protein
MTTIRRGLAGVSAACLRLGMPTACMGSFDAAYAKQELIGVIPYFKDLRSWVISTPR